MEFYSSNNREPQRNNKVSTVLQLKAAQVKLLLWYLGAIGHKVYELLGSHPENQLEKLG